MGVLGERSATIYQFPKGGRAGLSAGRDARRFGEAAAVSSRAAVGEAWYHAEAISAERDEREH